MGKMFKIHLCGDRIYSCSTCRTHLAKHDQIVSKVRATPCACRGFPAPQAVRTSAVGWRTHALCSVQAFQGRHGRAFLFSNV